MPITPASEYNAIVQAGLKQDIKPITAEEVCTELTRRCANGMQYTTFANIISQSEAAKLESLGYIVTPCTVDSDVRYGAGDLYIGFQVALNERAAEEAMQITPNGSGGGGGGDAKLEDKTANPSTSQQVITASAGYDGLRRVTISAVTSDIDPNITAENIKKNVEILGMEGSLVDRTFHYSTFTYVGDGQETLTLTFPDEPEVVLSIAGAVEGTYYQVSTFIPGMTNSVIAYGTESDFATYTWEDSAANPHLKYVDISSENSTIQISNASDINADGVTYTVHYIPKEAMAIRTKEIIPDSSYNFTVDFGSDDVELILGIVAIEGTGGPSYTTPVMFTSSVYHTGGSGPNSQIGVLNPTLNTSRGVIILKNMVDGNVQLTFKQKSAGELNPSGVKLRIYYLDAGDVVIPFHDVTDGELTTISASIGASQPNLVLGVTANRDSNFSPQSWGFIDINNGHFTYAGGSYAISSSQDNQYPHQLVKSAYLEHTENGNVIHTGGPYGGNLKSYRVYYI